MKVDFKVVGNNLVLKKKLLKNETFKFNNTKNRYSLNIFKKPQWVSGITSMTEDMKHILMLDYDNTCKWIVEKELKELSESHSPFYLFTTKEKKKGTELVGNYHAICLQKFSTEGIVEIQKTTHCDNAYRTMPLRNMFRSWVLRQSDKKGSNKPKFLKIIGSSNLRERISSAHLNALHELYPEIPNIKYEDTDGLSTIRINHYETA